MCGIIGWKGKVPEENLNLLTIESQVRGMHHIGERIVKNAGIRHCRYITSGEIHQPVRFGPVELSFNGVIDMGTKKEMEKRWGVKMRSDNDGELFLQLCNTEREMVEFISNSEISFAGIMLTDTGRLLAIRNPQRPLWKWKGMYATVLASTKDILERAGFKKTKTTELIQLEPYKLYEW